MPSETAKARDQSHQGEGMRRRKERELQGSVLQFNICSGTRELSGEFPKESELGKKNLFEIMWDNALHV